MAARFTSPPDPISFEQEVWDVVRQIPGGKVSTYGRIAEMIPPPAGMDPKSYQSFGARWVGGAMAGCPSDVPWQRVINAQGKISVRHAAKEQRKLLEAEGIQFDERQRVDFKIYLWEGI